MLDLEEPWLSAIPAPLRRPLAACTGDVPANIAAMQLLMEARDASEAEDAATAFLRGLSEKGQTRKAERVRAVLEVLRANPQAWSVVKGVLDEVRHDSIADSPEEQVRRFALAFDRAAQSCPEGSVALYALGNPDLLKTATADVVEHMRGWGLLGPGRRVLDLGCGIGRFGKALANEVESLIGVDISREMIEAARRRCACPNVTFLVSSGHDLSAFEESRFDLVLAVDTFPYLVQAGMTLVERHFAEAARVLKDQGDLLILNFSYRGDPEQDRKDIRRLSQIFGYQVLRDGVPAFDHWDGLAFHLVKVAPPG